MTFFKTPEVQESVSRAKNRRNTIMTDREKIISILSEIPFEEGTTWSNVYALMADRLQEAGFHRDEIFRDKNGNCLHLHYDSLACFYHDCHTVKYPEEVLSVEEARRLSI